MTASTISLWRRIQRQNFTNLDALAEYLSLTDEQRTHLISRKEFPLNLPRRLASKIAKGTLDDPILRQFISTSDEKLVVEGYSLDPVGDQAARCDAKLLHKYYGRVLLVTTSACAMHCRYCFRQHFSYAEGAVGMESELSIIAKDSSIREVILSGGDPLSLSDERLATLIDKLNAIPHLTKLRFHTRFPIGIPERVTEELIKILQSTRLQVWFVIHVNHPNELDCDIFDALKSIRLLGIPILNQAVLLRGINDSAEVLAELCEQLSDNGIQPYYLHQLDRVAGAHHFESSIERGKELIQELTARLPGYAVPRYVQEIPGKQSKSQIV